MILENVWCEECDLVHWVELLQQDTRGRITKTKCHGKDFTPTDRNPKIDFSKYYIRRHGWKAYQVVEKMKNEPRKKLPTTFHRTKKIAIKESESILSINRVCLAEVSLSVRGQFVTIKVFEDATPEKFYEFFYTVGGKAGTIKPRNIGQGKAVHISEIGHIFKAESKANPIFHNREKYEKLFVAEANSVLDIIEKNNQVVSNLDSK